MHSKSQYKRNKALPVAKSNICDYWISNQKRDAKKRQLEMKSQETQERAFGIDEMDLSETQSGWLLNCEQVSLFTAEDDTEKSGLKLYFKTKENKFCTVKIGVEPYLYVKKKQSSDVDITSALKRLFPGFISKIEKVKMTDLEQNNHLSGIQRTYFKISFPNTFYFKFVAGKILKFLSSDRFQSSAATKSSLSAIEELREHDVDYVQQVMTDRDLRVGQWYEISFGSEIEIVKDVAKLDRPHLKICAFDIETMKAPLRFPDPDVDEIIMISLMIDGQGFLIVNRSIVSEDIEEFEYTPKPHFKGPFKTFNEKNESCLLERFFELLKRENPSIYITFNGDFFDWPLIEKRCEIKNFSLESEIGIFPTSQNKKEFRGRFALHLDAFSWVRRDSYLPIGSQGLKAVTREKLGYNPVELDPEEMVEFARSNPQELAVYSVSDAVATYYLYVHYVHSFVFSLCTIIPLPAHLVSRKGTGTLCEALLMAEAARSKIIAPNKQIQASERFYKNRLVDSETYVGGHVECIEAGVFRDDIPMRFKINETAVGELAERAGEIVRFAAEVESKLSVENVENFEEVVAETKRQLRALAEKKTVTAKPLIYHFDVISMYPNIILSNRLQPVSIVTKADCAACDFNLPENDCKRFLTWKRRIKTFPLQKGEFEHIKAQLDVEELPRGKFPKNATRFSDLRPADQKEKVLRRVKEYCRKAYKRVSEVAEEKKESCVCQRENSFYVDTVRAFRDRRYTLKALCGEKKKEEAAAKRAGAAEAAKSANEMAVVYDSMQLAHKCILNSFYGYVMRKSSRWYSMPMAAITTNLGAEIIKGAREFLEGFARPLELDTDGVWCCLPQGFPTGVALRARGGESVRVSFLCSALNVLTHARFANAQYQSLVDSKPHVYEKRTECSVFFEEDGPYRCMMLPASAEDGKTLKKRYAVFSKDGSLVELKGFELKRRGELKALKIYQTEVFKRFLMGANLSEVYGKAAEISNYWLDIIDRKGRDLRDEEIFDLFSESKNMGKNISEYEIERSTSITCAKRLEEFLGEDKKSREQGLSLRFVVSRFPQSASVSDRVIPTVIFYAEDAVKKKFLGRWCSEQSLLNLDVREIIDWEYYKNRLGVCIRKIVTLPAAVQNIPNPVPRLAHPKWLNDKLKNKLNPFNQSSISSFFAADGQPPKPQTSHERFAASENVDNAAREAVPAGVRIERSFARWNAAAKTAWRALKRRRPIKRRRADDGAAGAGAKDYVSLSQRELGGGVWQILKVERGADGAGFRLWVFAGANVLRRVSVRVDREFFVNRYFSSDNVNGTGLLSERDSAVKITKSSESLLSERPSMFLYRVVISGKDDFLPVCREKADFRNEGVYGSGVPAYFKLISQLTFLAKVKKNSKISETNFSLNELKSVSDNKRGRIGYLGHLSFEKVFIYHSSRATRGFLAFFEIFENERNTAKATLIFVNPTKPQNFDSVEIEKAAMGRFKAKITAEKLHFKSFDRASKHVESLLKQRLKPAKTVILAQISARNAEPAFLKMAQANFPVFPIEFHSRDSKYPAFQWEKFLVDTALKRFVIANDWWEQQLAYSRYSKIPIGNLKADNIIQITDTLFYRLLKQSQIAPWASESSLPDFGGRENDRMAIERDLVSPLEIKPGFFRTYCVEISLAFLAVCSILTSDAVERLEVDKSLWRKINVSGGKVVETAAERNGDSNKNAIFRKLHSCFPVSGGSNRIFAPLKKFVKTLFCDVALKESDHAETILENFYRWVGCKSSVHYDPELHGHVHFLMGKYLSRLVNELTKLGVVIILSSFDKIIIATEKVNRFGAIEYVKNIIETVKSAELFGFLEMAPVRTWCSLVFYDEENYAGAEEAEASAGADDVRPFLVTSHWNIGEFLPREAEKCFQVVLSIMVAEPLRFLRDKAPAWANREERRRGIVDFCADLAKTKITRYLFKMIPILNRTLVNVIDEQNKFWKSMSSCDVNAVELAYNPTLLVTNLICHVLSLDTAIEKEVGVLKRSLLKLLGVPMFSPDAQFEDPGLSFVLSDVVCEYCGHVCGINLCKSRVALSKDWGCAACGHSYDLGKIEMALCDRFARLVLRFHSQDETCEKCKKVNAKTLSKHCECSGEFAPKMTRSGFIKQKLLYQKISEYYGLQWLKEMVTNIDRYV